MALSAALLKRLESLENRFDGNNDMKIFFHFIEENPIGWELEDPGTWQQVYPKGRAIIFKVMDLGAD